VHAITAEQVSFAYPEGNIVLEETSFSIPRGVIACIAGESGSGKTTLGYIFKGLIPHAMKGSFRGHVTVGGLDTRHASISTIARVAGMLFQNLDAQIFSASVLAEVEFGLKNLKMDTSLANDALRQLGLESFSNRSPLALSAGQKQRVLLAAVIAPRPVILILDEPTAHLDKQGRSSLERWLVDLNAKAGMTIIIFDQDPHLAGAICTRHYIIREKKVITIKKEDILEEGPGWRWKDATRE
jgi:energy-coupling factor transport system ATP-binding protein